ncbi:MAG TPA: hypothetical protein VH477_04370, partial [Bryobacteraceae bacterium]
HLSDFAGVNSELAIPCRRKAIRNIRTQDAGVVRRVVSFSITVLGSDIQPVPAYKLRSRTVPDDALLRDIRLAAA